MPNGYAIPSVQNATRYSFLILTCCKYTAAHMTFSLSKTADDPLQAFFYNNPLPCLILEKGDGQILYANTAAAAFFNVPQHHLQRQCLTNFTAPEAVSPHALLKKFDANE